MNRLEFYSGRRAVRYAFAALAACTAAYCAPIVVTPTVTLSGGVYHYNYSVTNGSGNDLPVLDIMVKPGASTISNLTAPAGFQKQYDSVLGDVSFLENTSTFGSSPIAGFTFDSALMPANSTFTATLVDSNFNLLTTSGATLAPVATPEPGYLSAFVLLSVAFLIHRACKSQTVRVSTISAEDTI